MHAWRPDCGPKIVHQMHPRRSFAVTFLILLNKYEHICFVFRSDATLEFVDCVFIYMRIFYFYFL